MAQVAPAPSPHSQLPTPAALAASKAVQAAINESTVLQSAPRSTPIPSSSSAGPPGQVKSETAPSVAQDPDVTLEDGEIRDSAEQDQDLPASITVFSSPTDFNVKHPLYSNWTLWFDNASKNDKAQNWEDLIQRVMEIESVEEFWGLYHNIVPPSLLQLGSNYYLFKEGIRPAWEDPANQRGGRWSVQLPRDRNRDFIDKWWLYCMLAAIGETFETPFTPNGKQSPQMTFTDEVTGVIISSRKTFFRISIWTRSSDTRARAENIGKHLKYGVLGVSESSRNHKNSFDCEFQSHQDCQRRKKGGWTV